MALLGILLAVATERDEFVVCPGFSTNSNTFCDCDGDCEEKGDSWCDCDLARAKTCCDNPRTLAEALYAEPECEHNYEWFQNFCAAANYPVVTSFSCEAHGYESIADDDLCTVAAVAVWAADTSITAFNNGEAPHGCFVTEDQVADGVTGLILNKTDMNQELCSETRQCICRNPANSKTLIQELHHSCKSRGCHYSKQQKTCEAQPVKKVKQKYKAMHHLKTKYIKCDTFKYEMSDGDEGQGLCECFPVRQNPQWENSKHNRPNIPKLEGCEWADNKCSGRFRFRAGEEE